MPELAPPVCRGCMNQDCEPLGVLPAREEFAGISLPKAIPGGGLYRCNKCSLVFRSPILTEAEYNKLYERASAHVWVTKNPQLRTDQSLVKDYIEHCFPVGAKVLDVGCYTGEFLISLGRKHARFGIEKSESAARHAEKNGIQILRDDLYEAAQLKEKFDVVTAMDVIEHTTNPDLFLKSMLALLTDTGILIITTGDAGNRIWRTVKGTFWYCSFAEHISFISEEWLHSNAKVNNFRVAHLQRFRYETRNHLKTVAKVVLIHVCKLFARQPRSSWTAHVSADHLFAVIRR